MKTSSQKLKEFINNHKYETGEMIPEEELDDKIKKWTDLRDRSRELLRKLETGEAYNK